MAMVIDLRDVDRTADLRQFFLHVYFRAVLAREAVTKVTSRIVAEVSVGDDDSQAHTVFIQLLSVVLHKAFRQVGHGAVRRGDPAAAAEVPDGEIRIALRIVEQFDLARLSHAELFDLHSLPGLHPLVERADMGHDIAHIVVRHRDRVVIVGPGPVDGPPESQAFGRLRETAQGKFFSVAPDDACVEVRIAGMVAMIVGEQHIVHVAAVRIDALHIACDPVAGMPVRRRQYRNSQFSASDGIVVAAVDEHRGSVRENHER